MNNISEIDKQFIEDFETLQERNLEAGVDEVYTVSDCRHRIMYSDYDAKYINILLLPNDDCAKERNRRNYLAIINNEREEKTKISLIRKFAQKMLESETKN